MLRIFYFILLFFPLHLLADTSSNSFEIEIIGHKFVPSILVVPSGKKIKLIVKNRDDEAEEFESFDLKREKIISPKSEVTININPLKPGEYKFFGEFHIKTAQGTIIAKEIE